MKQLTEENNEEGNESNNTTKIESMNITMGEIFPKKVKYSFFQHRKKFIRIIIYALILILLFFPIYFLTSNLRISNKSDFDINIPKEEDNCYNYDKDNITCLICKYGYKLIKSKCVLNHSFKCIYQTDRPNRTIKIIDSEYIDRIEMYIGNESIKPLDYYKYKSDYYKFESQGNHTIYMSINTTNLSFFLHFFILFFILSTLVFNCFINSQ